MVKKKVSIRDKVAQIYQTLSDVQPDVKVNDTIVTYLDKIQQSLDKLVNTGSSSDNLMQFSTDVDTVESGITDSEKKVPSSALVKNIIENLPEPENKTLAELFAENAEDTLTGAAKALTITFQNDDNHDASSASLIKKNGDRWFSFHLYQKNGSNDTEEEVTYKVDGIEYKTPDGSVCGFGFPRTTGIFALTKDVPGVTTGYSETAGEVYDVTYINDMFDAVLQRVRGL